MPKTMREQLEESFENAEQEEQEEAGGSEEESEESVGDPTEEESIEEELEESESPDGDDDESSEEEQSGDSSDDESISDESDDNGDEKPSDKELKAPVSWTPASREHWKGLPADVKREVLKREEDIQRGLRDASQHKKVAQEYVQTIQPYQQMIQGAGATPSEAIRTMFDTASTLTFGTPKQKAMKMKEVIENYSVDIELLDTALADIEIPDDQNAPLMKALDERLKPVTDFMGQFQSTQQQQTTELQQKATTELEAFAAKSEFYEDVREDMADLFEVAGRRNRQLTLDDAYEQACQLNPEIKKILDHRAEKARAARPDPTELARKRAAASSLKDEGPNTTEGSREGAGLRDTISAAFDEAENA